MTSGKLSSGKGPALRTRATALVAVCLLLCASPAAADPIDLTSPHALILVGQDGTVRVAPGAWSSLDGTPAFANGPSTYPGAATAYGSAPWSFDGAAGGVLTASGGYLAASGGVLAAYGGGLGAFGGDAFGCCAPSACCSPCLDLGALLLVPLLLLIPLFDDDSSPHPVPLPPPPTPPLTPVPEPSSLALLAGGLLSVWVLDWRRRRGRGAARY